MRTSVFLLALFVVACATPIVQNQSENNSHNQTIEIPEVAVINEKITAKEYTAAAAYAEFRDTLVVVETICVTNITYKNFSIAVRAALKKSPIIYPNVETGVQNVVYTKHFYGSGFLFNGKVYTNNHVISCSDDEIRNETIDAIASAVYDFEETGHINTEYFNGITHINTTTESATIYTKNMRDDPDYTVEAVEDYLAYRILEHIIDYEDEFDAKVLSSTVNLYSETDKFEKATYATVLTHGNSWPGADYAILEPAEKLDREEIQETDEPEIGEDVYIIGFPNLGVDNTTTKVPKNSPVITKGIASTERVTEKEVKYYAIDATSTYGASGSPVLNYNGKLIGILTAGNDEETISWILPINQIEE